MTRSSIAHRRKTILRHVIPFDEGITLHRALGAVLALAALGHTFAHVCNYRYGTCCDAQHNANARLAVGVPDMLSPYRVSTLAACKHCFAVHAAL